MQGGRDGSRPHPKPAQCASGAVHRRQFKFWSRRTCVQQQNSNMAQNSKLGLYVDGIYIAKLQGNNMDLEIWSASRSCAGRKARCSAATLSLVPCSWSPEADRGALHHRATEAGNYNSFKGV